MSKKFNLGVDKKHSRTYTMHIVRKQTLGGQK